MKCILNAVVFFALVALVSSLPVPLRKRDFPVLVRPIYPSLILIPNVFAGYVLNDVPFGDFYTRWSRECRRTVMLH